jgi:ribonuclease P protein component
MKYAFAKQARLLRPADFEHVFAARMSVADGQLRMYAVPNEIGYARLGLTVSRKVGGSVDRNRWKRAIREAFRLTQHDLPPLDLVCIPHRTSAAEFHRIRESLPKLARQLATRLANRRAEQPP